MYNLNDQGNKVIISGTTQQIPSKQLKDEDDSIIDPEIDDSDNAIDQVKI